MNSMNYNNNCVLPNCYPPYRTKYDRALQARGSKFCQPSGMLVCDATGNLVMTNNGSQNVVEGYQRRRQVGRRRRPTKERYTKKKPEITLYLLDGCGFCTSTKDALKKHINDGTVEVKKHTEAPADVTGFPTMQHNGSGELVGGAVKSIEEVYAKFDKLYKDKLYKDKLYKK